MNESLLDIFFLLLLISIANHSTTVLKLRNTTNDKNIYFKFKTTKPKIYVAQPVKGVLVPNGEDTDVVSMYQTEVMRRLSTMSLLFALLISKHEG